MGATEMETGMSASAHEAERTMRICNACRYCEGHCAVFPAMELRLAFNATDLSYLANLCHDCGACYHHCQYAEPHEFAVNVPRAMSELRRESYAAHVWPGFLAPLFRHNAAFAVATATLALIGFLVGVAWLAGPERFLSAHGTEFYGVMPHGVMAGLFGAVGLFVLVAMAMGIGNYWCALNLPNPLGVRRARVWRALRDALTLEYLDGGNGDGCTYPSEAPSQARRVFHHLTFYGFMLCFAATSVGALYHYVLGWEAPYGLFSLPKLFGVTGGIGLLIGPLGLLWLKRQADPTPRDAGASGMNVAFLMLLFLTSLTGLGLMLLSGTALVGPALAIHLGVVLALFLTLPYGKFIHGFYRLVALLAYAMERSENKLVVRQRPLKPDPL